MDGHTKRQMIDKCDKYEISLRHPYSRAGNNAIIGPGINRYPIFERDMTPFGHNREMFLAWGCQWSLQTRNGYALFRPHMHRYGHATTMWQLWGTYLDRGGAGIARCSCGL